MKKAVITLTDLGGDDVHITCEYGGGGMDDSSTAHGLAARCLLYIVSLHDGDTPPEVMTVDDSEQGAMNPQQEMTPRELELWRRARTMCVKLLPHLADEVLSLPDDEAAVFWEAFITLQYTNVAVQLGKDRAAQIMAAVRETVEAYPNLPRLP